MSPKARDTHESRQKTLAMLTDEGNHFGRDLSRFWVCLKSLMEAAEKLFEYRKRDAEQIEDGYGEVWATHHRGAMAGLHCFAEVLDGKLNDKLPAWFVEMVELVGGFEADTTKADKAIAD